MKLPIPNDWPAPDWICIELQWPNSPLWVAMLNGWLSQMARGRTYDETTGSILAAMEIGREIWARNTPFTLCCEGETPSTPTTQEQLIFGGDWFGDNEEDEMGCSCCIRWNAGILELLSCGEWVAVPGGGPAPAIETPEGDDVGDPEIPQPGDDTDVDVDVKCRAAYAIARAMWRVHARIIDYVDDIFPIFDIGNKVSNDLPEYTLTKYHVSLAASSLLAASLLADVDLIFTSEEEYVADMANWFKKFMPTRYTLSRVEYEALAVGLLAYSFHEGIELNLGQLVEGDYWRQIFWALGPGTVNDIMAQSRTMAADEFDCHERTIEFNELPVPPTDNGPWFSGQIIKVALDGAVTVRSLSPDMRKISLTWTMPAPGAASTDWQGYIMMIAPVNLTSVTFKLTGNYPLANWHSLPYNNYSDPHIAKCSDVTGSSTVLLEANASGTTWRVSFTAGKPSSYMADSTNTFRFLPQSTEPSGGSMQFEIEILAFT